MARITRHELKKDALGEHLEGVLETVVRHRRLLAIGGLAVAIALAAAGGTYLYIRSQQTRAAEALTQALDTFHAPVFATPPQGFTGESYTNSEEKYKKSLELFQQVADRYAFYAAGRWARYYAALCQRELGNLAVAESELQGLTQQRNRELASLARLALADTYALTGRKEQADTLLRELEEHPTVAVPKARAQMARADLHRVADPKLAAQLYQQIQNEYGGTAAADLAAQRLSELPR